MKELKEVIKHHISLGELDKAISFAKSIPQKNSEVENEIILISASFNNVNAKWRKGTISSEDYSTAKNVISEKLLKFSERITNKPLGENIFERISIDNLISLTSDSDDKILFEILISNLENYDKWINEIVFGGILSKRTHGASYHYYRTLYEINMPVGIVTGVESTAAKGVAYMNKEYDWGYPANGEFEYLLNTMGVEKWEFEIKFSTNFKIIKEDKSIIRIAFKLPNKKLIEKEEEGSTMARSIFGIIENSVWVKLLDNNKNSIDYLLDDSELLMHVVNKGEVE